MGRKRKYHTDEERRLVQNEYNMSYYERNKEEVKRKNLESYYKKKNSKIVENGGTI